MMLHCFLFARAITMNMRLMGVVVDEYEEMTHRQPHIVYHHPPVVSFFRSTIMLLDFSLGNRIPIVVYLMKIDIRKHIGY